MLDKNINNLSRNIDMNSSIIPKPRKPELKSDACQTILSAKSESSTKSLEKLGKELTIEIDKIASEDKINPFT